MNNGESSVPELYPKQSHSSDETNELLKVKDESEKFNVNLNESKNFDDQPPMPIPRNRSKKHGSRYENCDFDTEIRISTGAIRKIPKNQNIRNNDDHSDMQPKNFDVFFRGLSSSTDSKLDTMSHK